MYIIYVLLLRSMICYRDNGSWIYNIDVELCRIHKMYCVVMLSDILNNSCVVLYYHICRVKYCFWSTSVLELVGGEAGIMWILEPTCIGGNGGGGSGGGGGGGGNGIRRGRGG